MFILINGAILNYEMKCYDIFIIMLPTRFLDNTTGNSKARGIEINYNVQHRSDPT